MSMDKSMVDEIANAVLTKLSRGGFLSGEHSKFEASETNAVASAIAARLAHGISPAQTNRRRTASEGTMRLASAVSYKLGKASDPKVQSLNRVASEIAKALYDTKGGAPGSSPSETIGVHSAMTTVQK